jgi:hypothetical protein
MKLNERIGIGSNSADRKKMTGLNNKDPPPGLGLE